MNMIAYFVRPWYLLALPIVGAALVLVALRSYAGLSRARRRLALTVRLVVVTLLTLAAADVHVGRRDRRLSVLFVADASRSVGAAQRAQEEEFIRRAVAEKPAGARFALLTAAGEASLATPWCTTAPRVRVPSAPRDGFTNLEYALRTGIAAMPSGGARRMVLLSDGNENEGDLLSEVLAAREAGVTVDVVPLVGGIGREALVDSVSVSPQAKKGEAVEVRVTVDSRTATAAELHLVSEGRRVAHRRVRLRKGKNVFVLTTSFQGVGFHEVRAVLEPAVDQIGENNLGAGFTLVRGRPKVLYVEGRFDQAFLLKKALRAQDIEVDVCGSGGLPGSLLLLEQYDAVILSDVPAPDLSEGQMRMLKSAVRDAGVGLVMIGGRDSFAVGGYFDTPVEDALPVKMEVKHKRISQRTAVVIVIDKSGSMGMIENGTAKYLLANEAACATARMLTRVDSLGVIATDSVPRVVVPLQRAVNKDAICDQIATIRPGGGGIYCRASLEAAGQMLADAPTGARHLILLADGADSEQQKGCLPLAEQFARNRITVTCIAIGAGQDVPFLRRLAEIGKGRFYLTNLAANLPRIFAKETALAMRTQLVEEPFTPIVSGPSDILNGIDAFPPLLGYVAVTPKPLATVSLMSPHKDPVLATWQYGLGRAVAFTSSCKTGWGVHWVKWRGYGKFWSQLVRWVMRRRRPADFDARVEWDGDRGRIVVDAVDKRGRLRNFETFRATVAAPSGEGQSVVLEQTAPGRYEGSFKRQELGSYVVTIRGGKQGRETLMAGVSVPYAPDLRDLKPNVRLLQQAAALGGGRVLEEPRDAFRPGATAAVSAASLAPLLLATAMVLFVFDVAVRRLMIEPGAVVAFAAKLAAALRERRKAEQAGDETMSRLLQRKTTAAKSVRPPAAPVAPPPTDAPPPRPEPASPSPSPEPSSEQEEPEPADTLARLKRAKRSATRR